MNRLLIKDAEAFNARFEPAATFLQAAHLRHECYVLSRSTSRPSFQQARLEELLVNAPACREPWFVNLLQVEAMVDEELNAASLL
jgi:hypothetical protein